MKYREVLQIPSPHPEEHPGLALFTPYSVIPMLRFYSFTFRFFILSATALVLLFRPLWYFIRRNGRRAPAIVQNITHGFPIFGRSIQTTRLYGDGDEPDDEQVSILSYVMSLPSYFYHNGAPWTDG